MNSHAASLKTLGIFLFPDFELLDATGPLEMFGKVKDHLKLVTIAEHSGPVYSSQGIAILAEYNLEDFPSIDILLIPGGQGTRREVYNTKTIDWIKRCASMVELQLSVCTGAALLAKAGLLDHKAATTNKLAFQWVQQQGPKVQWMERARWVESGDVVTSSGVAAGIDMSLQVIARLYGYEMAEKIATLTEYVWNRDPSVDAFSRQQYH